MSEGFMRAIFYVVKRLQDEGLTLNEIRSQLKDDEFFVPDDILIKMWHANTRQDFCPRKQEKTYPNTGFEKLILDKLDRIIIAMTGDKNAPYMKVADFKKEYDN